MPALAAGYAVVLLGTNAWLELSPRRTESRVLHATSTDIAHLVRDAWVVLPASALFTRGSLGFAIVGCVLFVGLLEMSTSWRTALAVAVTGHVIGTLVSGGVVALRIATGDLPNSARNILDVGPSYALVACAAAVIASPGIDGRLRFACAIACAPVFAFTAVRLPSGRVDAIGHLTSAVSGLVWAWWLHRRGHPAELVAP